MRGYTPARVGGGGVGGRPMCSLTLGVRAVGVQGRPAGAGGGMRKGGVGLRQQSRRNKGRGKKKYRQHENRD